MFDELIHAVLEEWSNVTVALFAGIGAAKILSVVIPLFPAAYGVYVKWRSSGYRLIDRLEEFLAEQETKVSESRRHLADLLQRPPLDPSEKETAFHPKSLNSAVRKLDWGFGTAAPNDLSGAVVLSAKRAELARKLAKEHEERQALAHLLLGAKAAARQIDDPTRRSAARSQALEEFDNALKINPRDAEALEYSAMMLLELNEPVVALERIETLISIRMAEGDGANLGRAHRLEAVAYENQMPPKNRAAYDALLKAVEELPPGMILDCAIIYEHLAKIAQKLNYPAAPAQHLKKAWAFYHKLRKSPDGERGLHRVSAKLDVISRAKPDGGDTVSIGSSLDPVQPVSAAPRFSFLISKMTARPNG